MTTNTNEGGLLEELTKDMLLEEKSGREAGMIEEANYHVNKNYCPQCGKKYSSGSIAFCPQCGHPRIVEKTW